LIVRGQFAISGTFWRVNEAGHLVDPSPVSYPLPDFSYIEASLAQIEVDHENLRAQSAWGDQVRAQEKEAEECERREVQMEQFDTGPREIQIVGETAADFAAAVQRGDAMDLSGTDTWYKRTLDGLMRVEG
jgi:hypothetical protein